MQGLQLHLWPAPSNAATEHYLRTGTPEQVRTHFAMAAPSGKLTMIARPNQIAEEKRRGKSVRGIDKEGSRLRGRTQIGTESPCFATDIAALVFPDR
jgi:hypothetical protein